MKKQQLIDVIEANHGSMFAAGNELGLTRYKFRKLAEAHGLWKPNQSGKGMSKKKSTGKYFLADILEGKHPQYGTNHLKVRLIEEGIKENKCESCGITDWNGRDIVCELDHINGDSSDHRLDNLRILCPNCHSQTETYCRKKV